jgi:SAM-dependent methyltransferase
MRNARVARAFELQGKRVLDVGCAEGLHALYIAEHADEVVGIDHETDKIDIAQATANALGITNARFVCGDVRDSGTFSALGRFDLVLAWGFIHRISDVFSLLYTLQQLSDTLSLEWRTPALPWMSALSLGYHPPGGDKLDPTNLPVQGANGGAAGHKKIEGEIGFWEPTPGAVISIARRLGYVHHRVLGYGEHLEPERRIVTRRWARHLAETVLRRRRFRELPRTRVHMLIEKKAGSVRMRKIDKNLPVNLPVWDVALARRISET